MASVFCRPRPPPRGAGNRSPARSGPSIDMSVIAQAIADREAQIDRLPKPRSGVDRRRSVTRERAEPPARAVPQRATEVAFLALSDPRRPLPTPPRSRWTQGPDLRGTGDPGASAPSAPSRCGKRGQQVRRWLERRGRRAVRPRERTGRRPRSRTCAASVHAWDFSPPEDSVSSDIRN